MNLSSGLVETFQVMASVEASFQKGFAEKNWKSPTEVSAYLDLESSSCTGQIRFHFNRKVLVDLFKKMTGEVVTEDAPEVLDIAGEISNMAYGHAKAKLNGQGYKLQMSLPQPRKTIDLPKDVSHYPNIVVPFTVVDETCYFQIIIY